MPALAAAAVAGLLFASGAIAVVVGLAGTAQSVAPRRRDWVLLARRAAAVAGLAGAAGRAWLVTGWPVTAVLVVVAVWLAPLTVRQTRRQRDERAMLEATRAWLQQLATTAGAGVGLESALRESARQARANSPIAAPLRQCLPGVIMRPRGTPGPPPACRRVRRTPPAPIARNRPGVPSAGRRSAPPAHRSSAKATRQPPGTLYAWSSRCPSSLHQSMIAAAPTPTWRCRAGAGVTFPQPDG